MAIAFDAVSTAEGANSGSQESFAHSASGTDRMAVVIVAGVLSSASYTTFDFGTIQYDGNNMTQQQAYCWSHATTNRHLALEVHTYAAPPTGSKNITFTPSRWLASWSAICLTYTGVDSTVGNSNIANGTSTSPSVSVTTQVANAWLVGGDVNKEGSAHTPGTSQNERADDDYDGAVSGDRIYYAGGDEAHASAASHTHDWTITSAPWICSAVELQPAETATTETGSVTADAVIEKEASSSVTGDAVIEKEAASSVTADAAILRTESGSITSDAVVQRVPEASVTADAVIFKTTEQSVTGDATIFRVYEVTFEADAVVTKTPTGSVTGDAVIFKTTGQDVTADAVVTKTPAGSVTGDAVIFKTTGQSVTADAYITATVTYQGSVTANAVIFKTAEQSVTADAVVQKEASGSITADAYIEIVIGGSVTADAVIAKTTEQSITADAVVGKTTETTFTADAKISAYFGTEESYFLANAVIQQLDNQDTVTADAAIQRTESGSITADAFLIWVTEASVTADATIFKTQAGSLPADAWIVATGEKLILASAVVQRTESGSVTADAHILALGTVSGSITADAVIAPVVEGSITADAVVQAEGTGSILADAYIKSALTVVTGTIVASAWIEVSGVTSPGPYFRIEGTRPPNPRGSPKGNGYMMHLPEPRDEDGNRKAVGAVGSRWIEIIFEYCDTEVFDWYNAWVPDDEAWANIDSVQCWDPYADGGAQWVEFRGDDIRIWKPTVEAFRSQYYSGVRIVITNLG